MIFKTRLFSGHNQFCRIDQGQTALTRPLIRAASDQHVVLAGQYPPGQLNGVFDPFYRRHCADLQGGAIHQAGIKLPHPGLIEMRAGTGIKGGIIFQNGDGFLNCIEGRAAGQQDIVSSQGGGAAATLMRLVFLAGDTPGASVNDDGWFHKVFSLTWSEVFDVELQLPLAVPFIELKIVNHIDLLGDAKPISPITLPKSNGRPGSTPKAARSARSSTR